MGAGDAAGTALAVRPVLHAFDQIFMDALHAAGKAGAGGGIPRSFDALIMDAFCFASIGYACAAASVPAVTNNRYPTTTADMSRFNTP